MRGNGKIIQELEAVFRGAGWNVIKVIWGSKWDELLAQDKDGVLLNKMNATVDGEFQRYAVESGEYASTSSALIRGCARWCRTSATRSCATCPRRARLPQAVRGVQGGGREPRLGPSDGDPRQDDQGLDARAGVRGPTAPLTRSRR